MIRWKTVLKGLIGTWLLALVIAGSFALAHWGTESAIYHLRQENFEFRKELEARKLHIETIESELKVLRDSIK